MYNRESWIQNGRLMSDVAWDLPTRRGPSIQRLYCQWARELSFQDSDSRLPSHRKGRWKFWYGLLQKEFLANFKRVCFICLITIYGKSMDIFLVLKKHVLKAKLFANLANSTEVVPLKTDRGHVAPRIVTSWPTRHFRRDFVGIKNGSDCIKPHPEISHTYPSILILM